jgi:DNA polymerase III gamma/tau subunit
MGLAHVHRPATLDEIIGNQETVRALDIILTRDRHKIPHAFMFTGKPGGGKTTLGRIVGKMLGSTGRDLKEMDSAQFNGVATIRQIRSDMSYAPMESKCMVWLLDECHRLSPDAQDALLKALEDAPDHVYFILCTSKPDKMDAAIHRRCKAGKFDVQSVDEEDMIGFVRGVASKERKRLSPDILQAIARRSDGSCGMAVALLDRIIDLDPADILAVVDQESQQEVKVVELSRAMMQRRPWAEVAALLTALLETEDAENLRLSVMGYAAKVLMGGKDSAAAYLLLDCFKTPTYVNKKAGLILAAYETLM